METISFYYQNILLFMRIHGVLMVWSGPSCSILARKSRPVLSQAGRSGLTVLGHIFSPEGFIVPFLLVPVIGAAGGLAPFPVAFFPQLCGALAKIRLSLGCGSVVEFGF